MNFDNVPAGREMDKLIARLMGWTWDEESARSPTDGRNWRKPSDPWWWLPHYSTDVGDAWEVVEKFRLFVMPWGSAEDGAWVAADKRDANCRFTSVLEHADTAPLAICRAALKLAKDAEGLDKDLVRDLNPDDTFIHWDTVQVADVRRLQKCLKALYEAASVFGDEQAVKCTSAWPGGQLLIVKTETESGRDGFFKALKLQDLRRLRSALADAERVMAALEEEDELTVVCPQCREIVSPTIAQLAPICPACQQRLGSIVLDPGVLTFHK